MAPNDPTNFSAKVTGFTDGEGYFGLKYINIHRRPTPQARFGIDLRADDYMILKVKEFFGCGNLYSKKARPSPTRENTKPATSFITTDISDLKRIIVPHFERYVLESKKERDFAIWKQAIELMYRVSCRSRRGRRERTTLWTDAELAEFESLRLALKKQRRFESSGLIIPTPTNGKANPQRLLFEP